MGVIGVVDIFGNWLMQTGYWFVGNPQMKTPGQWNQVIFKSLFHTMDVDLLLIYLIDIMATFKYKIVEFTPDQKMEKAFNELGKEGWELVSVTPIGLNIEGDFESTPGYGGGETKGKFDKVAAYFKKQI